MRLKSGWIKKVGIMRDWDKERQTKDRENKKSEDKETRDKEKEGKVSGYKETKDK